MFTWPIYEKGMTKFKYVTMVSAIVKVCCIVLFGVRFIVKQKDVTCQLIMNYNLFLHVCLHLFSLEKVLVKFSNTHIVKGKISQ